jgi:hypothetical protein
MGDKNPNKPKQKKKVAEKATSQPSAAVTKDADKKPKK